MYDLKEIEYKKYDFFQEDYLYNFSPNWKNNEIQKNLIKHIADELEKTITHENYTSFRYIHFLIKLIKK